MSLSQINVVILELKNQNELKIQLHASQRVVQLQILQNFSTSIKLFYNLNEKKNDKLKISKDNITVCRELNIGQFTKIKTKNRVMCLTYHSHIVNKY